MPTASDLFLVLVYTVVLFVPGLILARAAGLRWWTSVAAAPLLSYGITTVAGPLSSQLGLAWGPLTLLAGTVVLAGLVVGLRLLAARRAGPESTAVRPDVGTAPDRRGDWIVIAGVALGALLGAITVYGAVGTLQAINQDWDATFHANAVRFIADTADASPAALAAINNYELGGFFYPNTYHALAAIVGELTGATVPALLNAQMLVLPGMAGLGLAALIRAHRGRVLLAATVPILLAAFTGFPYDLLWRGPLLPYATGIALVPAFLLLLGDTLSARRPATVVVTAIAAVSLLGLHPSAALTAAIFALPLVVYRWWGSPASVAREALVVLAVAVVAVVIGVQFALGALSAGGTGAVIDWAAVMSPGQAVGDVLLLNHARPVPQYWLVGLIAAGVLGLTRIRQLWWLLAGTGAFVFLFVAAASFDLPWAETVTQPWWNDRWRFVAVVVLGLAVVAGHGVVMLADTAISAARRIPATTDVLRTRLATGVAAAVVLSLVGVLSAGFYSPANSDRMSVRYGDGPTVSSAERDAMAALATMVGPDERVMNDPGDGSAWMYALEGVRPVYGHVVNHAAGVGLGSDQLLLLSSFRCLDAKASVRALVDEYNISHVFVGQGYVRPTFTRAPGLRTLGASPSLNLVYDEDGIRIYEIEMAAPNAASSRLECAATGS